MLFLLGKGELGNFEIAFSQFPNFTFPNSLHIKPKMHHIPILHHIFLSFNS